jgi:hypothetical protein
VRRYQPLCYVPQESKKVESWERAGFLVCFGIRIGNEFLQASNAGFRKNIHRITILRSHCCTPPFSASHLEVPFVEATLASEVFLLASPLSGPARFYPRITSYSNLVVNLVLLLGLEPVGNDGGAGGGSDGVLALNLDGHALVLLQAAGEVGLLRGGGGAGEAEGLDLALGVGGLDGRGLVGLELL